MSSFEEHLSHEFNLYATRSPRVHQDLDELFKYHGFGHRPYRHHLEYVMEKYQKGEWTSEEARAAILHIIDDRGKIMLKVDWVVF